MAKGRKRKRKSKTPLADKSNTSTHKGGFPLTIEANGPAFLKLYQLNGNVSESCRVVGLARSTVYEWRLKYPAFELAFEDARQQSIDALELVARKRAMGEGCEPSDRIIIFLLKSLRPSQYAPERIAFLRANRASNEERCGTLDGEVIANMSPVELDAAMMERLGDRQ